MICNVIGHNIRVTKKVTAHINEYKCQYCGQEFTNNLNGNLEELTSKTKKLNAVIGSFRLRRMQRNMPQSA
jgi:transposase-like protein